MYFLLNGCKLNSAMPGQFVQSYWVCLNVAGSGDGVREIDVELKLLSLWEAVFAGDLGAVVIWSVLGAVSEEFALFAEVAKFVCWNELVSYDSMLLVNAVAGLH